MCTESQKKKFMDLFALADSDSEDEAPTQKSSNKGIEWENKQRFNWVGKMRFNDDGFLNKQSIALSQSQLSFEQFDTRN